LFPIVLNPTNIVETRKKKGKTHLRVLWLLKFGRRKVLKKEKKGQAPVPEPFSVLPTIFL